MSNNLIPWVSIDFEGIPSGPSKQRYTSLIVVSRDTQFQALESYASPQSMIKGLKDKKIEELTVAFKKAREAKKDLAEPDYEKLWKDEEDKIRSSNLFLAFDSFYNNNNNGEVLFAQIKKEGDAKNEESRKAFLKEIKSVIDAIKGRVINTIGLTFFDKESIDLFSEELEKRWKSNGPHAGFLLAPSFNSLNTFNSKFVCLLPMTLERKDEPKIAGGNPVTWVPGFLGFIAEEGENDPGIPLTSCKIIGLKSQEYFDYDERSVQARNGFFTWKTDLINGDVYIESAITTKNKDQNDLEDGTYRYLNTLLILSYLAYDLTNYFVKKYERYRIAPDGATFPIDKKVISPNLLKADLATKVMEWQQLALITDASSVIKGLTVTQDIQNKSAVTVNINPEIIRNFIGVNVKIRFTA